MDRQKLSPRFKGSLVTLSANFLLCLFLAAGVEQCRSRQESPPALPQPEVTDNGARIAIPAGADSSLFKSAAVRRGPVHEELYAPARVVLCSGRSENTPGNPLFLFDSPDNTSLYSTFRQNSAAYLLAARTAERTRDLYAHQSASGKEVENAESDLATATASLAETEGKLRAAGLDPAIFKRAAAGKAWIIAAVPESQLHNVKQGGAAALTFASYPADTFAAVIEAVGEVIDDATRTVTVRLGIGNAGGRFKPGMYAMVNFGQSRSQSMAVSQDALVTVQGNSYLFVDCGGGRFLRRAVAIGEKCGDSAIVLRGVLEGERVVVTGAMLLKGLSFGY
jgi:hypothetical protein